jgi:hypothetical protein
MSIAITQEPLFLTPSDNPIIYGFGTENYQPSPNSSLPKYKLSFIVKVFLQNVGEIGVFEIYPELSLGQFSNSYGKINISNIVRSYIGIPDIVPKQYNSNVIFDSAVNCLQTNILVYEKYATTENGETSLHDSVVSSVTTVFKGSLSDKEFLDFDPYDYNIGNGTPNMNLFKNFLTDKPKIDLFPGFNIFIYQYDLMRDDSLHMSYFDIDYLNQNNFDKKLGITYSVNNTSTTFEILYPASDQGAYNSIYINLKSLVNAGYITQNEADNMDSLNIYLNNANTNLLLMPIVFIDFKKPCFYPGKSLKFLNKYGAFDYFLFEHNERKSASIESFEYITGPGYWDMLVNEFKIDRLRDGKKTYLKQTKEKLQLISGYLEEKEQNWLTQLYESPLVYLNYNNGDVQNVIITNSSYTIKQDQYDELYNEIVEIEFTTKNSIEL